MALSHLVSGSFAGQFTSGAGSATHAFDAGTASNRVLYVAVNWSSAVAHSVSGVTYNSVAMTALGAAITISANRMRAWRLVAPASGANNIVVSHGGGAGVADYTVTAFVVQDADQTTPHSGYTTATGTDFSAPLTSSVTVTSEAGDLVVVAHSIEGNTGTPAAAPTNYTERTDQASGVYGTTMGDAAGAASVATTATWTGPSLTNGWIAFGWSVNPVSGTTPVGPLCSPGKFLRHPLIGSDPLLH